MSEEIKKTIYKKKWKPLKLKRQLRKLLKKLLKNRLELANERADEFENKYLRAHAEMQNIQRRSSEERQQLQRYRSQDLAKAILPSLDNLERALAVEGLTDDVKKGLEMTRDSLIQALKEEGVEE